MAEARGRSASGGRDSVPPRSTSTSTSAAHPRQEEATTAPGRAPPRKATESTTARRRQPSAASLNCGFAGGGVRLGGARARETLACPSAERGLARGSRCGRFPGLSYASPLPSPPPRPRASERLQGQLPPACRAALRLRRQYQRQKQLPPGRGPARFGDRRVVFGQHALWLAHQWVRLPYRGHRPGQIRLRARADAPAVGRRPFQAARPKRTQPTVPR